MSRLLLRYWCWYRTHQHLKLWSTTSPLHRGYFTVLRFFLWSFFVTDDQISPDLTRYERVHVLETRTIWTIEYIEFQNGLLSNTTPELLVIEGWRREYHYHQAILVYLIYFNCLIRQDFQTISYWFECSRYSFMYNFVCCYAQYCFFCRTLIHVDS